MTKVVYFVCLLIRTEAPLLSRRASVAAAVPLARVWVPALDFMRFPPQQTHLLSESCES